MKLLPQSMSSVSQHFSSAASSHRPAHTPSSAARREPHTFVNAHAPASWEVKSEWSNLMLPPMLSTIGKLGVGIVPKTPLPKTVQELMQAPPELMQAPPYSAGARPWNVSFAGLQVESWS